MSRRKRSAVVPQKIDEAKRHRLSWNMMDCVQNGGGYTMIHDTQLCDDMEQDLPREQDQNESVANSNSVQCSTSLINDKAFDFECELLNLDNQLDTLESLFCRLGSFGGVPCNKIMYQSREEGKDIAGVIIKLNNPVIQSCSSLNDRVDNFSEYLLVNDANVERLSALRYLQSKGLIVVVKSDDNERRNITPANDIVFISVYLTQAAFSKVVLPSEDPCLKLKDKMMKVLVEWFHCIQNPTSEPSEHGDKLEFLFDVLKKKRDCGAVKNISNLSKLDSKYVESTAKPCSGITTSTDDLETLQHSSLAPSLRRYQLKSVKWMISREMSEKHDFSDTCLIHPLWREITIDSGKTIYYNAFTGRLVRERPCHKGYPSGGILADEMGLGKTVEVLACILNHPMDKLQADSIATFTENIVNNEQKLAEHCLVQSTSLTVASHKDVNHDDKTTVKCSLVNELNSILDTSNNALSKTVENNITGLLEEPSSPVDTCNTLSEIVENNTSGLLNGLKTSVDACNHLSAEIIENNTSTGLLEKLSLSNSSVDVSDTLSEIVENVTAGLLNELNGSVDDCNPLPEITNVTTGLIKELNTSADVSNRLSSEIVENNMTCSLSKVNESVATSNTSSETVENTTTGLINESNRSVEASNTLSGTVENCVTGNSLVGAPNTLSEIVKNTTTGLMKELNSSVHDYSNPLPCERVESNTTGLSTSFDDHNPLSEIVEYTSTGSLKKLEIENGTPYMSANVRTDVVGQTERGDSVETERNVVNVVRCICGRDATANESREVLLKCSSCGLIQHSVCIGLKKNSDEIYSCPDCIVKKTKLESRATLIISPVAIAHQWLDEIHRHVLPGSLDVLVYEGVAKQGFIYPSVLADNDVVLTTYEALKKDFHHLATNKGGENRSSRHRKRYASWPSPLTCIKYWRICLDEAQMVESTTAKAAETALHLQAVHRWCVTGTPIQRGIEDLYGLFLFLGVEPYYRKNWWKKLLYEPFLKGDSKPLLDVLYNIMWRTAKKDVIDEINLPEQKESVQWLYFSPVEEHFYRRQHEECSSSAFKELNKFQESMTKLNSLDKHSVQKEIKQCIFFLLHSVLCDVSDRFTIRHPAIQQLFTEGKVMGPLLRLRQACCHPQAVRGCFLSFQKRTITMEQLLETLIAKAKKESEEAHRLLLCATNGLAGTYILQEDWGQAVECYREAMDSWKEHEELIKTDSLQKLHTLHNLHEVLEQRLTGCSHALNDDFLPKQAFELREKYMERWRDQVTIAETDVATAQNTLDELKVKVDFKCPWWAAFIESLISSEEKNLPERKLTEKLVGKVKDDLSSMNNIGERLSMVDSFTDLRGLEFLLVSKLDAIEKSHDNLFTELDKLRGTPSTETITSVAECCLRPVPQSKCERCTFCHVDDIFSYYESLLFGHQGVKAVEQESQQIAGGLRGETEVERVLKSIYNFMRIQKQNKSDVSNLQQQAQAHFEYLELMKKNFKAYRHLWFALREHVSALDELEMCTMRLRLRYPGEKIEENQIYIINPIEVDSTQMRFRSDKVVARSDLRRSLGQLLYLKNLAMTQSKDGGENVEPCLVCTKQLGTQWNVFPCGHCLCCQCLWILLNRAGVAGRPGARIKCPMCRANTSTHDISYVSTVTKGNADDIAVKGSHSTKIEAIVRTLLRIRNLDPSAKTLVFSTWQDVLEHVSHALTENNLEFRHIRGRKDFQESLEEFKEKSDVSVLLLPLQSGSNGLNIIEATHVILVEPSLNPSLEKQAVGRIHRIGQTKPTFVHRLLIRNTVEEKITTFLRTKTISGIRCGTRRTDNDAIPLTLGELASFFEPPAGDTLSS